LNRRIRLRVKLVLSLLPLSFEYFRKISSRCHVSYSPRALNPNFPNVGIKDPKGRGLPKISSQGLAEIRRKIEKNSFFGTVHPEKVIKPITAQKSTKKLFGIPNIPFSRRSPFRTVNHCPAAGYLTPPPVRVHPYHQVSSRRQKQIPPDYIQPPSRHRRA